MITAVVAGRCRWPLSLAGDCKPAMVKAVNRRILSRNMIAEYIGYAGHRLQSSVGVVLTREDVKRASKNARSIIARCKGSSQVQARVKDPCGGVSRRSNKMVGHIYIGQAAGVLEACHQAGRGARTQHFSAGGRCGPGILEKVCTVLISFQKLQTLLEDETYVTGSLMIPLISYLRNGLKKAAGCYCQPPDMAEEA